MLWSGVVKAGEPYRGAQLKRQTVAGQLEKKDLCGWKKFRSSEGEVTFKSDEKRCRLEAGGGYESNIQGCWGLQGEVGYGVGVEGER